MRKAYLRFRRLVDADFNAAVPGARPGLISLGIAVLLVALPLACMDDGPAGLAVAVLLGGGWTSFCAWRLYRMAKAGAIRGDRHYDRVSGLMLSAEYRNSESATSRQRRTIRARP